jgi:hypothetical protein
MTEQFLLYLHICAVLVQQVEYVCRNACQPSLIAPTFSPARKSQRRCALQGWAGIPVRLLGNTHSL